MTSFSWFDHLNFFFSDAFFTNISITVNVFLFPVLPFTISIFILHSLLTLFYMSCFMSFMRKYLLEMSLTTPDTGKSPPTAYCFSQTYLIRLKFELICRNYILNSLRLSKVRPQCLQISISFSIKITFRLFCFIIA